MSTKKVLIIEDELDIREILEEYCRILNFSFESCEDGKNALEIFKKDNIDIIISDIRMPDMDGYEFVKEIRKKNKDIPILICSGYIDDKTKEEFHNLGANEYIEKPFGFSEIKSALEKYL